MIRYQCPSCGHCDQCSDLLAKWAVHCKKCHHSIQLSESSLVLPATTMPPHTDPHREIPFAVQNVSPISQPTETPPLGNPESDTRIADLSKENCKPTEHPHSDTTKMTEISEEENAALRAMAEAEAAIVDLKLSLQETKAAIAEEKAATLLPNTTLRFRLERVTFIAVASVLGASDATEAGFAVMAATGFLMTGVYLLFSGINWTQAFMQAVSADKEPELFDWKLFLLEPLLFVVAVIGCLIVAGVAILVAWVMKDSQN